MNILDLPCTSTKLNSSIAETKVHTFKLNNTSTVSIPSTSTSMLISKEAITSTPKSNNDNSKMREVHEIIDNNDQMLNSSSSEDSEEDWNSKGLIDDSISNLSTRSEWDDFS